MLEAEADQLCQAQKHQRSVERQGYRSGHYQRSLHTRAGDVKLKVPKLGKSHIRIGHHGTLQAKRNIIDFVESIPDFHPKAKWRRCVAHFHRNVLALVPQGQKKRWPMLKAIHAKGKPGRGGEVSKERTAGKLSNMKFGKAAELARSGSEETFSHHGFPALSIGNESGPITVFDKNREGDPRKDRCHRLLPRWRVSSDVGCRQVATYCRFDME